MNSLDAVIALDRMIQYLHREGMVYTSHTELELGELARLTIHRENCKESLEDFMASLHDLCFSGVCVDVCKTIHAYTRTWISFSERVLTPNKELYGDVPWGDIFKISIGFNGAITFSFDRVVSELSRPTYHASIRSTDVLINVGDTLLLKPSHFADGGSEVERTTVIAARTFNMSEFLKGLSFAGLGLESAFAKIISWGVSNGFILQPQTVHAIAVCNWDTLGTIDLSVTNNRLIETEETACFSVPVVAIEPKVNNGG